MGCVACKSSKKPAGVHLKMSLPRKEQGAQIKQSPWVDMTWGSAAVGVGFSQSEVVCSPHPEISASRGEAEESSVEPRGMKLTLAAVEGMMSAVHQQVYRRR